MGIAAALHAVVSFLLTRADIRTAADVLVWLNGSLNSANWDRAGVLGIALLVLVPAVAASRRAAAHPRTGRRHRRGPRRPGGCWPGWRIVITAVGLAAARRRQPGRWRSSPSSPGRSRAASSGRASLPASALTGVLIVLGADYVAANIAPLLLDGTVLPVGVVTGALGAPFLLWLLVTSNRKDA